MQKYIQFILAIGFSTQTHAANLCHDLFVERPWFQRDTQDQQVDYNNDLSYLRTYKTQSSRGNMRSFFNSKFDTRFYYANLSTPDAKGHVPVVSPQSKALYIFFHGSGTMKSSGKNFAALMNELASMGHSALSFDLPFHADGPMNGKFNDTDYFMNWVHQIIQQHRVEGQPVYLVGHSFGPEVIAEYLYRNPTGADGAAMISPAGFTSTLAKWQEEKTDKMKFGGDVQDNTVAGQWAGTVADQFQWNKGIKADPTLVNPHLKIRMLSGNREEYVPAPTGGRNGTPIGPNTYDIAKAFKRFFSRAQTTVENGVGHYIFEHQDQDGQGVVMRELLALNGESAKNGKKIKEEINKNRNFGEAQLLAIKYNDDLIFRAWVDLKYGNRFVKKVLLQQNAIISKKIIYEYDTERQNRIAQIVGNIRATQFTHPQFFNRVSSRLNNKGNEDASLLMQYLDFLEEQDRASQFAP